MFPSATTCDPDREKECSQIVTFRTWLINIAQINAILMRAVDCHQRGPDRPESASRGGQHNSCTTPINDAGGGLFYVADTIFSLLPLAQISTFQHWSMRDHQMERKLLPLREKIFLNRSLPFESGRCGIFRSRWFDGWRSLLRLLGCQVVRFRYWLRNNNNP